MERRHVTVQGVTTFDSDNGVAIYNGDANVNKGWRYVHGRCDIVSLSFFIMLSLTQKSLFLLATQKRIQCATQ